jgi:hypothetical protein
VALATSKLHDRATKRRSANDDRAIGFFFAVDLAAIFSLAVPHDATAMS